MSTIIWGILFLAFITMEAFVPTIEWLFLAAGALLTGLLSMFVPGLDGLWWLQILIWGASSFGSIFVFQKFFKKAFIGQDHVEDLSEGAGERAIVIEAIAPEQAGRIKYQGTTWTAVSETENIAVGEEVEILEHKGMVYLVTAQLMEDFPEKELRKTLELKKAKKNTKQTKPKKDRN
jgi:membrane protein implicated in regulation of membrane protease activity